MPPQNVSASSRHSSFRVLVLNWLDVDTAGLDCDHHPCNIQELVLVLVLDLVLVLRPGPSLRRPHLGCDPSLTRILAFF